ncbi:hypothetical protein FRC10_006329 [Ceratobasidium sp. 414]|nr:hypothetical protein FRC10_006329 [Ceratobasidium sp. 414]
MTSGNYHMFDKTGTEISEVGAAEQTSAINHTGIGLFLLHIIRWPSRALKKRVSHAIRVGDANARQCDGKTPVCSLCEKSNYDCVYDATLDQRRPAQKNYVAALEARVALLENILKNAGAGDAVEALDFATVEGEPVPPDAAPAPASISTRAGGARSEPEPGFIPADDAAHTLKSVSLIKPEEPEENTQNSDGLDLGMGDYVPLISLEAEHKMLAQFWDWQRMHLPYVAPVPFLLAYAIHSETAHPNEPIPPPAPLPPPSPLGDLAVPRAASVEFAADLVQFISPLLLDSMFAIATLFNGDLEASERFYRRAETRLLHESANPRLATVQAALIMSTWELGHARAPATWTLLGVTIALCIRLGMNVDATPLVRQGVMSKRLFESRNFAFWATYNNDRFAAICLGMHPLMDRRMITTPRHSSIETENTVESPKPSGSKPAAGALEEKPATSDVSVAWDPKILGMGGAMIQAGWEAIRDLIRISEVIFDGMWVIYTFLGTVHLLKSFICRYSFDAPKRTPQEDLEHVTRNNLTIQRFLDELPAWLRSTGPLRKKENGLVYLHLFTHLTSIVVSRPFLSPRPLSEEAMRIDATTDPAQPNHSSHLIRRYRTLAFRVARASALQITSLIRHIPLSSPCVTLPYVIYSACTILLLAPDDQSAMDGVRASIACLERIDESGYWVNSAKDGKDRIQALAKRWGVTIGSGKKVLGHLGGGGPSGPGAGGSGAGGLGIGGAGSSKGYDRGGRKDTSTHTGSSTQSTAAGTRPSATSGGGGNKAAADGPSGTTHTQPTNNLEPAISQTQGHAGTSSQTYTDCWNSGYSNKAGTSQGNTAAPPSYNEAVAPQAHSHPTEPQRYAPHESAGYSDGALASGMVQPPQTETYVQPQPHAASYMPGHPQQPTYSGQQQPIQYQQLGQYQPQQVVQHVHYHIHSHTHHHPHQYQHTTPPNTYHPPRHQHVAYGFSHAEPQHDFHLPHTHWHQVLPPADPSLPFPPDPVACTDIAMCFADTVRTGQDPAFVQSMTDPYASVATDWFLDAQNNFALITPEMYGDGGIPSTVLGAETFEMYAQGSHMGARQGN